MDNSMNSLRGRMAGALALSVALLVGGQANAALVALPPGSNVSLAGQGENFTPGKLFASTTITANLNPTNPDMTGVIREAVFVNAQGTLDFLFQVTNTSSPANNGMLANLASATFANFGGGLDPFAPIRVDFATNFAGIDSFIAPTPTTGTSQSTPVGVSRSGSGSDISFLFDSPIFGKTVGLAAGATSNVLIISTNARNFNNRGVASISGETDANGNTLGSNIAGGSFEPAPGAIVPEPATFVGAGIAGLFGLGFALRRKRTA